MYVRIPTPLRSYTNQAARVTSQGETIREILADLDAQFPGIRFRVVDEQGVLRQHMKIFVNEESLRDLETVVAETDEITLMQGLSGG
jgi:sulfur-carrier protein